MYIASIYTWKSRCIVILVISLLLAFGCVTSDAQFVPTPNSPWKGRKIFQEKGCQQCHAIHGKGGDEGPDLGENKYYGSYLELASLMWNHLPDMLEIMQETGNDFPELTKEETIQLIGYISYIRYLGESGNERTGRKLLKNKGCMTCHKFGGEGGDMGVDFSKKDEYLTPVRFAESMWNHIPDMMNVFKQENIELPEFEDYEIVDIASGIRSYMRPTKVTSSAYAMGDPVKGKILIEKNGCLKCHSIKNVGGNLGQDFTEMDFNYSVTQIAGRMWNHGLKMWELMSIEGIEFTNFKAGEMADVIAYLYGLNLEDEKGNIPDGQKIITARGCLSCHSVKGEGIKLAVELSQVTKIDSPPAMVSTMWNHGPVMYEKLLEKKLQWPELSGRDMANLYAYLNSLYVLESKAK